MHVSVCDCVWTRPISFKLNVLQPNLSCWFNFTYLDQVRSRGHRSKFILAG